MEHKCVSKGVISQPWFTHLGQILPASTKHGNEEPSQLKKEEPRDPLKFATTQDITLGFQGEKDKSFSNSMPQQILQKSLTKGSEGVFIDPYTPSLGPLAVYKLI